MTPKHRALMILGWYVGTGKSFAELGDALESNFSEAIAEEREACAKVCEDRDCSDWANSYRDVGQDFAADIRARKEK